MQINSNYSMNGVLYETRRKQDNIPQFSFRDDTRRSNREGNTSGA